MIWPRIIVTLAVLLFVTGVSAVDFPSWWTSQGVLTLDGSNVPVPPDDFAALNQGQLKNITLGAFKECEVRLPGGPGPGLLQLIDGFTQIVGGQRVPKTGTLTDDFAVATVGQLKAVAQPFYTRFQSCGLAPVFPWPVSGTSDDFALANLGQVKRLFSFDLRDDDVDGMIDAWEDFNGFDKNNPADAGGDLDGDGLTNAEEQNHGTNPNAKDNPAVELSVVGFVRP
jgi:hypothetical protein